MHSRVALRLLYITCRVFRLLVRVCYVQSQCYTVNPFCIKNRKAVLKSLPILHSLKMAKQQMSKSNFIRVYFPFIQRHYYSFCFISATKKEFSKLASDSFHTQYVNLLFRFIQHTFRIRLHMILNLSQLLLCSFLKVHGKDFM